MSLVLAKRILIFLTSLFLSVYKRLYLPARASFITPSRTGPRSATDAPLSRSLNAAASHGPESVPRPRRYTLYTASTCARSYRRLPFKKGSSVVSDSSPSARRIKGRSRTGPGRGRCSMRGAGRLFKQIAREHLPGDFCKIANRAVASDNARARGGTAGNGEYS